jgi:SAM-dependent methyltransferase
MSLGDGLAGESLSEVLLDNLFDMTDDSCVTILPHVLRATAQLGIADHLGDTTKNVDDLAAVVRVDCSALYRLLRALATVGVVEEARSRYFRLSALGQRLRTNSPASSRWSIDNRESAVAWTQANSALTSGKAVFDSVFGASFFSHKDNDPQAQQGFAARMRERARNCYHDFAMAADWRGAKTVMDIGGNDGYVLERLLWGAPHLSGVLFDRPPVIESAAARGCLASVRERCRMVAGDFFDSIPGGADTHLMCSVLHDWPDDRAVVILGNSRSALPPDGRLLIVEMLVPEGPEWHPSKWSDIGMMVLTGGRERSRPEFDKLFREAGLSLASVRGIPNSYFSLLEAVLA